MGTKYQISDSEWEIMKIIWASAPISANEIIDALPEKHNWAPKTVKTMLNRLVAKEILTYTKDGRAYLYTPKVTSEETINYENSSFLEKVYDGNFSSMVSAFVDQNEFSDDELDALVKILESKRR